MEHGSADGYKQHQQHHQHQHQHQHHPTQYFIHQHPHYVQHSTAGTSTTHIIRTHSPLSVGRQRRPPKLKTISRSISMAVDGFGAAGGGGGMDSGSNLIIEQPLIHRSASPLTVRSTKPPESLTLPPINPSLPASATNRLEAGTEVVISPLRSPTHTNTLRTAFPYTTTNILQYSQQQQQQQPHTDPKNYFSNIRTPFTAAPTAPINRRLAPIDDSGSGSGGRRSIRKQPKIYLVSGGGSLDDGLTVSDEINLSPIMVTDQRLSFSIGTGRQNINLNTNTTTSNTNIITATTTTTVTTHPFRRIASALKRSDTIDVHPASAFQMKKTHSFHAPTEAANAEAMADSSNSSVDASGRRTSSLRGNFLIPGTMTMSGESSGRRGSGRSPSPSRRGYRTHRSLHDGERKGSGTQATHRMEMTSTESGPQQIRHSSLNDDENIIQVDPTSSLRTQTHLSLENEIYAGSRSRSNSHMEMRELEASGTSSSHHHLGPRKSSGSGSFEETHSSAISGGASGMISAPPPPATSSSLRKRDHSHHAPRQHSSQSLELDGRPSPLSELSPIEMTSIAASPPVAGGHSPTMHLYNAATAANAAYHFKRSKHQGRSLYLTPSNLETLQQLPHRSGAAVLTAAAAFQSSGASPGAGSSGSASGLKQTKALHSASMRLRTYRETLGASKKAKSFIMDEGHHTHAHSHPNHATSHPSPVNEFLDITSPHRHNGSRSILPTALDAVIPPHSPRAHAASTHRTASPSAVTATTSFIEEQQLQQQHSPRSYELREGGIGGSGAAFEQVLRPFHHKASDMAAGGIQGSEMADGAGVDDQNGNNENTSERKRKRIVCLVMTIFLCLMCASILVVLLTLTHSSSSSPYHHQHHLHHQQQQHSPTSIKKTYTYNRDVPVHYNVRQENERLMKETMERGRYGKNYTMEATFSLVAATMTATFSNGPQRDQQQQDQQQALQNVPEMP